MSKKGYIQTQEHRDKTRVTGKHWKVKDTSNMCKAAQQRMLNNRQFKFPMGHGDLGTVESHKKQGEKMKGNIPGNFRGKIYQRKSGRWFIWLHKQRKRMRYSRYIAQKYLGRKLITSDIIHHINEDVSDDRPENLYWFSSPNEHNGYHRLKNKPILISNLNK